MASNQSDEVTTLRAGLEMWHSKFLAMTEQYLAQADEIASLLAEVRELRAELQRMTEERNEEVRATQHTYRAGYEHGKSDGEAALRDPLAQQQQLVEKGYVQHKDGCAKRVEPADWPEEFGPITCTCGLAALIDRSRQGGA